MSSSQCYRGLAVLSSPRGPGTMPVRGVPCPGGVPWGSWGISLAGTAQLCAVPTAAEPIQWRNYTPASAADAKQPQSTLSLPKCASRYWLHKVTRAQSCRFRPRTDCNTGERRLPPMSRRSADAYLCHEAVGMWEVTAFFPSKHGMPQTIPGCKNPPSHCHHRGERRSPTPAALDKQQPQHTRQR